MANEHTTTTQPGTDTPTGVDPEAKYDQPGYEDKSLGQAVNADQDLVDELIDRHDGDVGAAEADFESESAGAPARARQREASTDHATGEAQAAENRENDPPA